ERQRESLAEIAATVLDPVVDQAVGPRTELTLQLRHSTRGEGGVQHHAELPVPLAIQLDRDHALFRAGRVEAVRIVGEADDSPAAATQHAGEVVIAGENPAAVAPRRIADGELVATLRELVELLGDRYRAVRVVVAPVLGTEFV